MKFLRSKNKEIIPAPPPTLYLWSAHRCAFNRPQELVHILSQEVQGKKTV